jgi:Tol biopolymer transport system component
VDYEVRRRRLSYPQVLVLVLLPLLLSVAAWMLRSAWRRAEPLRVINTKQLTFNGQVGYSSPILENYCSIQTDGRRIYYTVCADNSLRSISVKGGEETPLASPLPDAERAILHVAPDGSSLLVRQLVSSKGANEAAVWVVATNGGAARRLGDIEAHDAAFAPDSKTIVFAKDRDLYLTDLQGLSPVKLVETPGRAFWLRWSPDGQRLRFTVSDAKNLRFSLWELGSDRKLQQLLKDWKAGAQPCCGIWSADGKYFLFSSNGQYWYVPEPISSTRAKPELLTTSGLSITAAAANPLEKEIFVSAGSPNFNVFKWDLKTDRTSILYPSLHPIRIHYSPDGQPDCLYQVRGSRCRALADWS